MRPEIECSEVHTGAQAARQRGRKGIVMASVCGHYHFDATSRRLTAR